MFVALGCWNLGGGGCGRAPPHKLPRFICPQVVVMEPGHDGRHTRASPPPHPESLEDFIFKRIGGYYGIVTRLLSLRFDRNA